MYSVLLLIILSILARINGQINILETDDNIETQGERIVLSDVNTFPLINSENLWSINLTNPGISFKFDTESTFNYLISSIQIQIFTQFSPNCEMELEVNPSEYIVYYQIGNERRIINLGSYNSTVSGDTATVNIEPVPADRIIISRSLDSLGTHCMRYGLIGERIARVCALFYDITLPNLFVSVDTPTLSDAEYTGLCSRTMCFGGKGRLMDGNSDIDNYEETAVGWICPEDIDLGCSFDLNIQLTTSTTIERIVLFGLSAGEVTYPEVEIAEIKFVLEDIKVENKLFTISIPIDEELTNIRMKLWIENGKILVLSEVALYSTDDINLSVLDIAYDFLGVDPVELPTSENIADFQRNNNREANGNTFVENTVKTDNTMATTVLNTTIQTNTTFTPQNTTFTPQNTTQIATTTIQTTPSFPDIKDCQKQSIFLSIIGVLSIFMITLLFNSVIIIALLAKNNRKLRRKMNTLEHPKNPASTISSYIKGYKMRHVQPELDLTVVQNRIAIDDMYDNPQTTSEQTNAVNMIHNIDSGFASPITPVPNIHYGVIEHLDSLSVPMTANAGYAQIGPIECSVSNESQYECCVQEEFEVPMEENVAYSSIQRKDLPQICVDRCGNSLEPNTLDIPMVDNVAYSSIQRKGFQQVCIDRRENSLEPNTLDIPMVDNVAYSSIPRKGPQQISIDRCGNSLELPMVENIGYISSRNALTVNRAQMPNSVFSGGVGSSDIKQIYSSIANECSVEFPMRKNGEFPSYNVLVHK